AAEPVPRTITSTVVVVTVVPPVCFWKSRRATYWWPISNKTLKQVQPSSNPQKPGSLLLRQAGSTERRSRAGAETALSDHLKGACTCVPTRSSCLYRTKYRSYCLL